MNHSEASGIVGTVEAVMLNSSGEVTGRCTVHNLITQVGDTAVIMRTAAIATIPAAPTGMRIGTGSTAAAKTGAGAAIVTKVTGGNLAFDATYPQYSLNGSAGRCTWRCTYGAGVGTSGSAIAEAVLVNDTIATDTATAAANTFARVVLTGLGTKGANDTLTLTWTWDHQGT